jgi:ATP-dependent Zn protease
VLHLKKKTKQILYKQHVQLLFFLSSGASSDFDAATRIAKMMVTRFGMCERVSYGCWTFGWERQIEVMSNKASAKSSCF